MATDFLQIVAHRPWPLPARPWVWRQRWDQVLLMHFRVPGDALAKHIPRHLALDLHDGSAWVSLVPFRMRHVRPRGLPAFPPLSNFAELNLRTYVVADGRPGVFFLRIQAGTRAAAWLARSLSPLPYRFAPLSFESHAGLVTFDAPELSVRFAAGPALSERSERDRWLTERYCLYAARGDRILRADVHHVPWPLVHPEVELTRNDMLQGLGVAVALTPELVHLSPGVEIVGWSPEPIGTPGDGGRSG